MLHFNLITLILTFFARFCIVPQSKRGWGASHNASLVDATDAKLVTEIIIN